MGSAVWCGCFKDADLPSLRRTKRHSPEENIAQYDNTLAGNTQWKISNEFLTITSKLHVM